MVTSNLNILIVEDEKNIAETLTERLQEEYGGVVWAASVAAANKALAIQDFDLALLDVGLPDGSGFDVAASIRDARPETAIVFLTAMGSPDDRVRGLELGAEDYIVKPFHLKELLLRIRNVLKRSTALQTDDQEVLEIGDTLIDFNAFKVTHAGQKHTLTHKECLLMRLFVEKRGQVVSRDQILDRVWPEGEFPTQRTVDNFIVRIRRLIDGGKVKKSWISSVRGVGYRLED